jgi:hypothetical protein
MPLDLDIRPTDRLPGIHLAGTVGIRLLVNYGVPGEALQPLMPPGCEASTHAGLAWLSVCAVRLEKLRPSILPRAAGLTFNYLIIRTVARLPYPDGERRESVMILESNIGGRLAAKLGRVTGIQPNLRRIEIEEDDDSLGLRMSDRDGTPLYRAEFPKASTRDPLPAGSRFGSREDSYRFLMHMSFGGAWEPGSGRISLLAETHDPCAWMAAETRTTKFDFLESLVPNHQEADHTIIMRSVPHQFALRGLKVEL